MALAAPVLASTLVVRVGADATRGWGGAPATVARLVLLVGLATVTLVTVRRLARRLLPLAALCRLALAFPERAPSRFKLALRTGTANQLSRQLADGERPATDGVGAAEQVLVLVGALGRHDRLTRGHSERVRAYADLVGEELDLTAADREKLHWAALVHDIGKTAVRPEILNKPGRPTDAEWQELRRHPEAADELIRPLRPWLGEWADAATQHHERPDGKGYPRGLRGEEISLAGRIVAVADAYDCMTSARSYKRPLPAEQARFELARNAGTQFDEEVVRAFLAISIGRLHLVAGPLAWLSQVPVVGTIAAAAPPTLLGMGASVAALALGIASLGPLPSDARQRSPSTSGPSPTAPSANRPSAVGPTRTITVVNADGTTTEVVVASPTTHTVTVVNPDGTTTEVVVAGPAPTPPDAATPGGATAAPGPGTATTTTGPTTSTTAPPATTTTPSTTATTMANAGPQAVADDATVFLASSVLIPVLANDSDPDDGLAPSSLAIVTPPASNKGTVSIVSGQIRFTAKTLLGQATFTYRICDTRGACATASVTVNVLL